MRKNRVPTWFLIIGLFYISSVAAQTSFTIASTIRSSTCGLSNGSILALASGGTAPYTYALDGGTPQSTGDFQNLRAGNHTLVVTDALENTTTYPFTVTNNFPQPTVTSTRTNPSGCTSEDASLTLTASGGTPPYQYTIDQSNYQSSNSFTGLSAGMYYLGVIDANGCSSFRGPAQYTQISENCSIYQQGLILSYVCGPFKGELGLVNVAGGTAPYQYSLDGGPYQSDNVFHALPAGRYKVYVKDASGKVLLYTVAVQDLCGENFVMSAIVQSAICGVNGSITVQVTTGAGPFTYSIDGINYQSNNLFAGLAPGSYLVYVKDGANVIHSKRIDVGNNCINIVADHKDATCGNQNGTITVSASNGKAPYQFALESGSYSSTNVFSGLTAGVYQVHVKDADGVIAFVNTTVGNIAGPSIATASVVPTDCSNRTGAIALSGAGGTAPYQYSLDGSQYQNTSAFSSLGKGKYLTSIKDANGCVITTEATVALDNDVYVEAGNDAEICEGTQLTVAASTNATSYAWTSSTSSTNATTLNPTFAPTVSTRYYLKVTTGICSAIDSLDIAVEPAPVADAGADIEVCPGNSTRLSGSGGESYLWTPSNYLSDPHSQQPDVIRPLNTTTYSLTVVGANGCSSVTDDRVRVTVTAPPRVSAGRDTVIVAGQQVQLTATDINGSGFNSFNWSPQLDADQPFNKTTTAHPQQTTWFVVRASTAAGCEGSDTVKISVFPNADIYVPTAFTPNGDGRNDILRAIPVGISRFEMFAVYDRWGQQLFRTTDATSGWKGQGALKTDAIYIWIARGTSFDGKLITRKGTVMVIL